MLHVTWTEWKNMFSLEVYCRTAKLQVDGLVRSYGPQTLRIYRMSPELGPPELEERTYGTEDLSWAAEWEHFAAALAVGRAAARRPRRRPLRLGADRGRLRVVARLRRAVRGGASRA